MIDCHSDDLMRHGPPIKEKLKATATSHAVFPMIINDPMGVSLEDLEAYQHGGCKGQELVPTHNAVGSTRGS